MFCFSGTVSRLWLENFNLGPNSPRSVKAHWSNPSARKVQSYTRRKNITLYPYNEEGHVRYVWVGKIISLFRRVLLHLPVPIYVKTGIICNCAKHWPLRFQSISWLKTLTGKIWAISELRGCQNKNYGEHTNKRRRMWITLPSMSHRLIQPTFVKVPTDISLGTEFLMTLKHCWANGKECLI